MVCITKISGFQTRKEELIKEFLEKEKVQCVTVKYGYTMTLQYGLTEEQFMKLTKTLRDNGIYVSEAVTV